MRHLNATLVGGEAILLIWALATAVRWFATPTGQFEPSIVLATILIAILEFVRRRVRRTEPAQQVPAEPFPLSGVQQKDWRSDPVIGAAISEAESAGASFAVPYVHQAPRKLAEGFTYFLTADGRRCHYFGSPSSGEEFVLMIKRPAP